VAVGPDPLEKRQEKDPPASVIEVFLQQKDIDREEEDAENLRTHHVPFCADENREEKREIEERGPVRPPRCENEKGEGRCKEEELEGHQSRRAEVFPGQEKGELPGPVVVVPDLPAPGVRKGILNGDVHLLEDELPRFQVHPDVQVGDPEKGEKQKKQEEEKEGVVPFQEKEDTMLFEPSVV